MSRFIKHVGVTTNTASRVVVVFRSLPDDENTALVVYSDSLTDRYHQDFMTIVEGITAQQNMDLFRVLNTQYFSDGAQILNTLHSKGLLKKVPTATVKMTPEQNKHIMLDELNKALGPVDFGANSGKRNPQAKPVQESIDPAIIQPGDTAPATVTKSTDGVLTDADLAAQRLAQAEAMEAEAARLKEEAYDLNPELKPKRGRPKKQAVEA